MSKKNPQPVMQSLYFSIFFFQRKKNLHIFFLKQIESLFFSFNIGNYLAITIGTIIDV